MDLFDYSNYESDSFIDSAPPPQILGSSGPHGSLPILYFRTFKIRLLFLVYLITPMIFASCKLYKFINK